MYNFQVHTMTWMLNSLSNSQCPSLPSEQRQGELPILSAHRSKKQQTYPMEGCLVQVGNGIELWSTWSPVRTRQVAPWWCDLGFVLNSHGNKAAQTESSWSPVRTLPVMPLWSDLGFVLNSRGNKAAATALAVASGGQHWAQ